MEICDYMDDCIHLKACRRVQKIGRKKGMLFARNCSDDYTAYQSKNQDTGLISVGNAIGYARRGVETIRGGYDAYDVYSAIDFCGKTLSLGDVLERLTEE